MFKIIGYLDAETNNKAIEAGYQYSARGDFHWIPDGNYSHNTCFNTYLFENLEEATEYIRSHDNVVRDSLLQLCHIKTPEEYEREEAEKKAKKLANEAKKAAAKNMSIEEYNEWNKKRQKARRYERRAKNLRLEIEDMMKQIEDFENRAKEIRAEIGEG